DKELARPVVMTASHNPTQSHRVPGLGGNLGLGWVMWRVGSLEGRSPRRHGVRGGCTEVTPGVPRVRQCARYRRGDRLIGENMRWAPLAAGGAAGAHNGLPGDQRDSRALRPDGEGGVLRDRFPEALLRVGGGPPGRPGGIPSFYNTERATPDNVHLPPHERIPSQNLTGR